MAVKFEKRKNKYLAWIMFHKMKTLKPNKLSQSETKGWREEGDILDGRLEPCKVSLWDYKRSTSLSPSSFCNRFLLLSAEHIIQGMHLLWFILYYLIFTSPDIFTRSSKSYGRSNVTDSLNCPNKFRLPW